MVREATAVLLIGPTRRFNGILKGKDHFFIVTYILSYNLLHSLLYKYQENDQYLVELCK